MPGEQVRGGFSTYEPAFASPPETGCSDTQSVPSVGEIRLAMESWNADWCLNDPRNVRQTLLTAINLLRSLQFETMDAFVDLLMDKLAVRLAPLD